MSRSRRQIDEWMLDNPGAAYLLANAALWATALVVLSICGALA